MGHCYDTHMTTKTIKEKWKFEGLLLLSGSSKFEKQCDLPELETVWLTWLVRNIECGYLKQSSQDSLAQNLDTVFGQRRMDFVILSML